MILDLFAGPGGWDEGARLAGYDGPLVGLEHDRPACLTATAAGHPRIQADVAAYPTGRLVGRVVGLIASPPCPTFSAAGSGAGKHLLATLATAIIRTARGRHVLADTRRECARILRRVALGQFPKMTRAERSRWAREQAVMSALTVQPMRYVVELRPRFVALEQVPAVLPLWEHMAAALRELGYRVWCGVLSAEEYGVPQTRKRAILVASLDGPVGPPAPTHQPYRAGHAPQVDDDLFGAPLPPPVSMAEALGWDGAVQRQVRGAGMLERHGDRPDRPMNAPSTTIVGGGSRGAHRTVWVLRNGTQENACTRALDEPAGTIFFGRSAKAVDWVMRSAGNGQQTGKEQRPRPADEPAATVTGQGSAQWSLECSSRRRGNNRTLPRALDDPAMTVVFGHSDMSWTRERPATTVQGDPRVWPPGHKVNGDDRARLGDDEAGERYGDRAGTDSVRVSVVEAGVLQSFPADYPWQGTKTQQYSQVGNAVPPLLAAAVLRPLLATVPDDVDVMATPCSHEYPRVGRGPVGYCVEDAPPGAVYCDAHVERFDAYDLRGAS